MKITMPLHSNLAFRYLQCRKEPKVTYRISSYSFRKNYSFLSFEIMANSNSCSNISFFYLINWFFAPETIQGGHYSKAKTIWGDMVAKEWLRSYPSLNTQSCIYVVHSTLTIWAAPKKIDLNFFFWIISCNFLVWTLQYFQKKITFLPLEHGKTNLKSWS